MLSRPARAFASIAALALSLAGTAPAGEAPRGQTAKQPGKSPVKVFILAGQSNMEGYGAVHEVDEDGKERRGTLTSLVNDPAKAPMFRHLRDTEGRGPDPRGIGIPATNDGFGDPAPNVPKKLEVEYSLGGKKHVRTVSEGEELSLPAGPEPPTIEKALYGDLPDGPRKDVTEKLRSMQYHPDAGWLKANGYSTSRGSARRTKATSEAAAGTPRCSTTGAARGTTG